MSINQTSVIPTAAHQTERFDAVNVETHAVAFLEYLPSQLQEHHPALRFQASWDDLDYLHYAILDLPSQNRIALMSYDRSPAPGTMICVQPHQLNIANIIQEAIEVLHLTAKDISWIHPEIAQ
jgi:hypothetical protein